MNVWKLSLCLAATLAIGTATAAEPSTLTVRITGLFEPDREKELRAIFERWPEVKIVRIDFDRAQAELRFDSETLYPKDKPADVLAKLDGRLRGLSMATFGIKAASTVARDKLARVEIAVGGLDCRACCLFGYEVVAEVEGVEQATASFREGRITALIDPTKTDKAKLEAALKRRGVTVK